MNGLQILLVLPASRIRLPGSATFPPAPLAVVCLAIFLGLRLLVDLRLLIDFGLVWAVLVGVRAVVVGVRAAHLPVDKALLGRRASDNKEAIRPNAIFANGIMMAGNTLLPRDG